jgi:hypothetical protein
MANIFCRSPFIIQIDEANQIETKVELFIWNGTGSAPTSPTYTLSKLIPAPGITKTTYNISPYLKEYISHAEFQNNYNIGNQTLTTTEWCNVSVKRFKKLTTTFTQVGTTTTYKVFDGYGLYTEGYNKDLGDILLDEGTYYFLYDSAAVLATDTLKRAGSITWNATAGYKVKYTELVTGTTNTVTIPSSGVITSYRVNPNYYDNGCLTQITDASNNVLWEATFKPKTECQYEPVCCDFINRYGAWQREYFFKASKNNINVENTEYNLLQNNLVSFDVLEGQRKTFNTNYSETITVNTDWVSEDFSENLRQLMTSERILLDNRPVKINTKSTELFKQINTKMINYTLEFQYASDIINNVV